MSIYDERPDDDYDVYIGNEPVRYQRRAKYEDNAGTIIFGIIFVVVIILSVIGSL